MQYFKLLNIYVTNGTSTQAIWLYIQQGEITLLH